MFNNMANIKWLTSKGVIDYPHALSAMEAMRNRLLDDPHEPSIIWLLEHAPFYSLGVSADEADFLTAPNLPIYKARRGGKLTYHGPGQRIIYLIFDLRQSGRNLRRFVFLLEEWVIQALALLKIEAHRQKDHIGVWVGDDKIAAIGLGFRHWVSAHGLAINLNPDLRHFESIIPCGIKDKGVTSLEALGCDVSLSQLDAVLRISFCALFQIPLRDIQSQDFDLARN